MRLSALLAATLMLTAGATPSVEKYDVDKSHTYIGFSVRHMMVTNVKGRFRNFDGEILLDQKDITRSSAHFTIDAASIDTENERRDNHLRSADFLNAAQFPTITFRSRRVQREGEQLSLIGDLTIRAVTREVVIPFELVGPIEGSGRKRIGAEGMLTIKRFDYGLEYNRFAEAVAVVAPDVKIELNVEAVTK
ncbi:MAG: YceI family protein [Gemmatimonadota bacterium]